MGGMMVDTSVLIHIERRRGVMDFSPWKHLGLVWISSVTASELLVGVHRADHEQRRAQRASFVSAVLAQLGVLTFDLSAARVRAELFAGLLASGTQIGALDLLIAATAVSSGCTLLTMNEREFRRVPGLAVIGFSPAAAAN